MKVLILGSGGREHAFAWKITKSSGCNKLFIAPGNAGTAEIGININLDVNDFEGIKKLVLSEEIELVLVGPEAPLVNGIYDFFQADEQLKHISLIGPSKKGAQLEGSKKFAKEFMMRSKKISDEIIKLPVDGDDFDQDGIADVVLAGNLFKSEIETPRNDAGRGLFLKGTGAGEFNPIKGYQSGLDIPGDVKKLKPISLGKNEASKKGLLVAVNDDFIKLISTN